MEKKKPHATIMKIRRRKKRAGEIKTKRKVEKFFTIIDILDIVIGS